MQTNYYKILEELRTLNGMTVADLCSNIIDERTYYRYLSGERASSLETFIAILNNISIDILSFLTFSNHFRVNDEKGSNFRFLFRVSVGKYDDIDVHYHNCKKHCDLSKQMERVIGSALLLYESNKNIITREEFESKSSDILKMFGDELNFFSVACLLIHITTLRIYDEAIFKKLDAYMKDLDFRIHPLIAMLSYELYLRLTILHTNHTFQSVKKVHTLFNTVLEYLPNRFYATYGYFYNAYFDYVNQKESYIDYLKLYVNNIVLTFDKTRLKDDFAFVEKMFKVNPLTLLKK